MMSEYIYFFLISYSGTLYVKKLLFVFMYLWGGMKMHKSTLTSKTTGFFLGGVWKEGGN